MEHGITRGKSGEQGVEEDEEEGEGKIGNAKTLRTRDPKSGKETAISPGF